MKLFSELWIETLGWTLLHSLWLIAAIALVLRLLLWLVPRSLVRARYILTVVTLLVVVGSLVFTGYRVYKSPAISHTSTATYHLLETTSTNGQVTISQDDREATFQKTAEQLQHWLSPHLSGILILWFSGMLFFLLRTAGKFAYVYRLSRQDTYPLSNQWETAAKRIKQALGIRRRVLLRASSRIRSPFAIGLFKPVILLPISSFSQLSYEQMEAVLAHELAHIRRWDDAVNWLQTAIEIVLFYHPALWWISQVVRDEREKCCDDLAVATCGNPLVYAKALTQLETLQSSTTPLALAFARQGGGLFARIERLLQPNDLSSKVSLAPLVLTFLLILSIFASYRINPNDRQNSSTLTSSPVYSGVILGAQPPAETKALSPWQPNLPDWLEEESATVDALLAQEDTIPKKEEEKKSNYYFYSSPNAKILIYDSLQKAAFALDSLLLSHPPSSPNIQIIHFDSLLETAVALDSLFSVRPPAAPDVKIFNFDSLTDAFIFSPDSVQPPQMFSFHGFDSDSSFHWDFNHNFSFQFSDTIQPPNMGNLNIPLPPMPNIQLFTDSISEKSIRVYERAMREYERALARLDSTGDWEENLEQQLLQLEEQQLRMEEQMRVREEQYEQQLQQWEERMEAWERRQQERQRQYEERVRQWAERQEAAIERQEEQQKMKLQKQKERQKKQREQ